MAYVGEARFRFNGPADLCSRYIPVARVLVDEVKAMYAIDSPSGAGAATHTKTLDDGTIIKVTVFAQAPPIITITVKAGGAVAKDTTVDNGFYFYNYTNQLNAGPRYEPGNVSEAYSGNLDDGSVPTGSEPGKWEKRSLPGKGRSIQRITYRFLSRDLRRIDDYPAWVTQWTVTLNSTYYINGKEKTAPGDVVGAIKEVGTDVVFTTTANPVTIHRYDKDVDNTWSLTWSSSVPIAGSADSLRAVGRTMQIKPDGLEALFIVTGEFAAPGRSNDNVTFIFEILYKISLVDGTITYLYGSKGSVVNSLETDLVSATDGDFPDGCGYTFATDVEIEAGVTTTATLRSTGFDPASPIVAPRVGDNFYLGSNPDPNSQSSSRIEVTGVSYTPEAYDEPGQIYTGSVEPHAGSYPSITFTWVKAGQEEDPVGSGTFVNVVYPAGSSIDYICQGDPTLTDYYTERTLTFTSNAASQYYGYDSNGNMFYAVYEHTTTIVDTNSIVGTGPSITNDFTFSDSGTTELVFVGGENDGVRILFGNQGIDRTRSVGLSNYVVASTADRFSGLDFYSGVSGTVVGLVENETAYAPTTGDPMTTQRGMFDAYVNALYRDTYGYTYTFDDVLPNGSIVATDKLTTAFRYTGAEGTRTETMPYSDVFVEDVIHRGAVAAKYAASTSEERGDGSFLWSSTYDLGGSGNWAAESFNASTGLREYKDENEGQAEHYPQWVHGGIASDPFHNVISVFDQGFSGAGYTLSHADHGFLWRARDGYTIIDPREMFTSPDDVTPTENAFGTYWGVIVTDVTVEEKEYENQFDAKDTRTETYKATYRPT